MKQHIFAFEKLEVWKKSKELVKEVYKLTRSFPEEEKFGLTSQIRRSAVSVVANIAEGDPVDGRPKIKPGLPLLPIAV